MPEDYGGYFAWGETEEKDYYDWSTYIHCDGTSETCHYIGDDIASTEYDVAHVKWGDDWQMPSFDQIKELLYKNVDHSEWSEWLSISGLNGKTIFLPATSIQSVGHCIYNEKTRTSFSSIGFTRIGNTAAASTEDPCALSVHSLINTI